MSGKDLTRRTVLKGAAGTAASVAATAASPVAAQETVMVELVDFAFEPGTENPLEIPPGTTVTFVWQTDSHNIVVESQPADAGWAGHESIEMAGFETEHTFEVEGTYEFFCQPHQGLGMEGTIVVDSAASVDGGDGGDGGGEGQVRPDFGEWLVDVDGGYQDARGEDEATVRVGGEGNTGFFTFEPAGLWVDPGTTVRWEWTGEGGGHNVVAEEGPADVDSGDPVSEAGVNYEYTVEQEGITTYFCSPHRSLGMKGGIAVGEVPTVSVGGGGDGGDEGRAFPAPGGEIGFAFIVLAIGFPAIAVLSVLIGELFGPVRTHTEGPKSAYTVGLAAAILGALFIMGIALALIL